jgi:hypothetical protein
MQVLNSSAYFIQRPVSFPCCPHDPFKGPWLPDHCRSLRLHWMDVIETPACGGPQAVVDALVRWWLTLFSCWLRGQCSQESMFLLYRGLFVDPGWPSFGNSDESQVWTDVLGTHVTLVWSLVLGGCVLQGGTRPLLEIHSAYKWLRPGQWHAFISEKEKCAGGVQGDLPHQGSTICCKKRLVPLAAQLLGAPDLESMWTEPHGAGHTERGWRVSPGAGCTKRELDFPSESLEISNPNSWIRIFKPELSRPWRLSG